MASAPVTNGVSHSTQSFDSTQPNSEPLDSGNLDTDPEVSGATQEATHSEGMARSTSNTRLDPTQSNDDTRQEAMDLNMEETRLPLRKDVSMREFLGKMDDYAPVIPDAVTFHALTLAGLKPPPLSSLNSQTQQPSQNGQTSTESLESDHVPLRLARLISLATQKFIADIATDAYQYSRMRTGVLTSNSLSAMANPGAAAGAGGAGGAAGGPSGAAVSGPVGGPGKSGANAHILGAPRAGFGGGGQGGAANRAVLTMEDVGMALGEYGVNVKRGEFYR